VNESGSEKIFSGKSTSSIHVSLSYS